MSTRLVCRSAPLPTKEIAWQMGDDEFLHAEEQMTPSHFWKCERITLASPQDTDNGQCWSEEIFSTLETP